MHDNRIECVNLAVAGVVPTNSSDQHLHCCRSGFEKEVLLDFHVSFPAAQHSDAPNPSFNPILKAQFTSFFFFFYKPIIFWSLMQHSFNSLKNPQLQPGWSFSENSENWFPVAALTGNQFLGFSILCGMIFSYCNIQKQLFSRHLWSITFPISRLSIGWHVAFSWMFRCHLLLWCLLDDAKWAVACGWDYF